MADDKRKELPPFASDALSGGNGAYEAPISTINNRGDFHLQGIAFLRQLGWEGIDGYTASGDSEQEKANAELQRMAQIYGNSGLLEFLNELAGLNFQPQDEIDRVYQEYRTDLLLENVGNGYTGGGSVFSGGVGGSHRFSGGFDPSALRSANLDRTQRREELATAIADVSGHYAPQADMDPKVMAKVLGAVGVIESRFGEARQVVSSRFKSSASGSMHFIDGTALGEYRQNINDNYIMAQLAQRVGPVDPRTKAGIMRIKDCDHVAVSWVAKHILEVVKNNPAIKNKPEAIFMELYQRHNMGEGAYAVFKKGGLSALLARFPVTAENNPMFFRGAGDKGEVDGRYMEYGKRAMNASARLIDDAFLKKNELDVTAPRDEHGAEPRPEAPKPNAANGAGAGGQPAQTPPAAAAGKTVDKPEVAAAGQGITKPPEIRQVAPAGAVAANVEKPPPQPQPAVA